jgi:hypothetical protein
MAAESASLWGSMWCSVRDGGLVEQYTGLLMWIGGVEGGPQMHWE